MKHKPMVFIVDDDADLRGALRYLMEGVGIAVEEYVNGPSFLKGYDGHRPACFVLDMRMPGLGGLDLLDELNKKGIEVPIILLTGYGDVNSAVRALKSGAADFIEKPFNNQEILDKIQRCLELDEQRQKYQEERAENLDRLSRLTPREREVLNLVVSGKANKVIANLLEISIKTVEVHRAHVMEKAQAANIAELLNCVKSTEK